MSGVLQNPVNVPSHLPIVLRPMEDSDRGFVVMTWMHSAHGRRCSGYADKNGQKRLANALIERCPVTIAAYSADPRTIIGWCCTGPNVVHYVWVRGSETEMSKVNGLPKPNQDRGYRRQGVASFLLRDYLARTDVIYTHAPSFWWQRKSPHTVKVVLDNHDSKNQILHQVDSNSPSRGSVISIPGVPVGWKFDPYLGFEIAATVPSYREHQSPEVSK